MEKKKKLMRGFNDLETVDSRLASELADDLNEGITAQDVTADSAKRLWWRCPSGHIWQESVKKRRHGHGCPYDCGKLMWFGPQNLGITNPALAAGFAEDLNSRETNEKT